MPTIGDEGLAIEVPLVEQAKSVLSPAETTDWSKLRTRAGVRVSINLQQFFSDHRARAFMWAPYGRSAEWLSRRIAHVFELPDDIALMCQGHLLPPAEPLLMLDRDDTVEVVKTSFVYTQHNKQDDPNITRQKKYDISAIKEQREEKIYPIHSNKTNKQTIATQLPSTNDNTEHENISGIDHYMEPTDPTADRQSTFGGPRNSMDVSDDLQKLKQQALCLLDKHCSMLQEGSAPKRVRRRRRRRRPASSIPSDDEPHTAQHSDAAPTSEDTSVSVICNGSGSRPPRIVCALSPSSALQ